MRTRGIRPQVVRAIRAGCCNTSQDVADETGLSVIRCSKVIHKMVTEGWLVWTDRVIRVSNYKFRVFEVVNA